MIKNKVCSVLLSVSGETAVRNILCSLFGAIFQAVINEDAQGNVAMLQAEIRRLKDALSKFQRGQIPTEPSTLANSGLVGFATLLKIMVCRERQRDVGHET